MKLSNLIFYIVFIAYTINSHLSSAQTRQATRLGLFHTQEELDIWRERAINGPYKRKGDAYPNSPNEWERIYKNAMNVLQNRNDARKLWKGVKGYYSGYGMNRTLADTNHLKYWNGYGEIPPGAGPAPKHEMRDICDAAFVALILKTIDPVLSKQLSDIVRTVIMQQVRVPNLDVTNKSAKQTTFWPRYPSSQWTKNISDRNPGFVMASFLQSMLLSYDFLKDEFTDSERKELDTWFHDQAEYWAYTVDTAHEIYFFNRDTGDWALTKTGKYMEQGRKPNVRAHIRFYDPSKPAGGGFRKDNNGYIINVLPQYKKDIPSNYIKSPNVVSGFVVRYNNRFGNLNKFVAMVGVMQNNEQLKKSAKLYWKETMMFAVYPDGLPGELERWTPQEPQKGFHYANFIVDQLLTVADVFARAGDTELYNFNTRNGAFGTECKIGDPDKNLENVIKGMIKLMDGTYRYYATRDENKIGDIDYRIWDRLKPGTGWKGGYVVYENWYAQANIYYKDDYIKKGYQRKNPGMNPLIANPEQRGVHSPYEGPWGEFPSKLFMFGLMEGKVWPYAKY